MEQNFLELLQQQQERRRRSSASSTTTTSTSHQEISASDVAAFSFLKSSSTNDAKILQESEKKFPKNNDASHEDITSLESTAKFNTTGTLALLPSPAGAGASKENVNVTNENKVNVTNENKLNETEKQETAGEIIESAADEIKSSGEAASATTAAEFSGNQKIQSILENHALSCVSVRSKKNRRNLHNATKDLVYNFTTAADRIEQELREEHEAKEREKLILLQQIASRTAHNQGNSSHNYGEVEDEFHSPTKDLGGTKNFDNYHLHLERVDSAQLNNNADHISNGTPKKYQPQLLLGGGNRHESAAEFLMGIENAESAANSFSTSPVAAYHQLMMTPQNTNLLEQHLVRAGNNNNTVEGRRNNNNTNFPSSSFRGLQSLAQNQQPQSQGGSNSNLVLLPSRNSPNTKNTMIENSLSRVASQHNNSNQSPNSLSRQASVTSQQQQENNNNNNNNNISMYNDDQLISTAAAAMTQFRNPQLAAFAQEQHEKRLRHLRENEHDPSAYSPPKSFRDYLEIRSESRCLIGSGLGGESLSMLPPNVKTNNSNLSRIHQLGFHKELMKRIHAGETSWEIFSSLKRDGWLDSAENKQDVAKAIADHATMLTNKARGDRAQRLRDKVKDTRPTFDFLDTVSSEKMLNKDKAIVIFAEKSERKQLQNQNQTQQEHDDGDLELHAADYGKDDADYNRERCGVWQEIIIAISASIKFDELREQTSGERLLASKLKPLARRLCATWRRTATKIASVRRVMATLRPPDVNYLKQNSPLFSEWTQSAIREFFEDAINNTRTILDARRTNDDENGAEEEKDEAEIDGNLQEENNDDDEIVEPKNASDDAIRRNRFFAASSSTSTLFGSQTSWSRAPCRLETFKKGECIYHAGDPGDAIFVIAPSPLHRYSRQDRHLEEGAGIVELISVKSHKFYKTGTKSKVNGGVVVESVSGCGVFGDVDALILAPRIVTARAATDVTVFRFSRRHLFRSLSSMPAAFVDRAIESACVRREKFVRFAYPLDRRMLLKDSRFAEAIASWDSVAVDALVSAFVPRSLVSHAGAEYVQRDSNIGCFLPLNTTLSVHATVLSENLTAAQRRECEVEAMIFGTCRSFSKLNEPIVPQVVPGSLYGFDNVVMGQELFQWRGYQGISVTAKSSGDCWVLSRSEYHRVALEHAANAVTTRQFHLARLAASLKLPPIPPEIIDNYCMQHLFLPQVLRSIWEQEATATILFTGDLVCREGANCKENSLNLKKHKESFAKQRSEEENCSSVGKHADQKPSNIKNNSCLKTILNEELNESVDPSKRARSPHPSVLEDPTNRGDIFVITRGAVSIHSTNNEKNSNSNSTSHHQQTAENIVCEDTAGQALVIGAFEFGLNSKEYLTTVRCSTVCEVWTLPAESLERRLREEHPLIWSAVGRISADASASESLREACRKQFDEPNYLVYVEHWPSSVGVYLPPRDELVAWRQNRHKTLRE